MAWDGIDHSGTPSYSRLFDELRDPNLDPARRQRLRSYAIERHLPLVDRCVSEIRPRPDVLEDAIQVGRIGLIYAVDRFDPARGTAFPVFARPTIVGEVLHYFRDRDTSIRVPRRHYDLAHRARAHHDQVRHSLGHEPTLSDLAAFLHVAPHELSAAFAAEEACIPRSLDSVQHPDELVTLDPLLEQMPDHIDLGNYVALLPRTEREVLLLHVVNEMTQQQVGLRLGLTQMQVSRAAQRAIRHLKALIDS